MLERILMLLAVASLMAAMVVSGAMPAGAFPADAEPPKAALCNNANDAGQANATSQGEPFRYYGAYCGNSPGDDTGDGGEGPPEWPEFPDFEQEPDPDNAL